MAVRWRCGFPCDGSAPRLKLKIKNRIWQKNNKGRDTIPPLVTCLGGKNLSNRGARGGCTRSSGVHADHAGLVGVVHVLSCRTHRDRRGRDAVGLIGRSGRESKVIAALLPGSQN